MGDGFLLAAFSSCNDAPLRLPARIRAPQTSPPATANAVRNQQDTSGYLIGYPARARGALHFVGDVRVVAFISLQTNTHVQIPSARNLFGAFGYSDALPPGTETHMAFKKAGWERQEAI